MVRCCSNAARLRTILDMSTSPFFPSHIHGLRPHVPAPTLPALARELGLAPGRFAQLHNNENPLGASPRALQALAAAQIDASRYPDSDCTLLSQALADHHGVPLEWIAVASGSETVIGYAVTAVLGGGGRRAAFSRYSFQSFAASMQRVGATPITVPSPDFTVNLQGLRAALDQAPHMVYIVNPGNPTGTCVDPAALHAFLRAVPSHVVVLLDEAYVDFLPPALRPDSIAWVREFPNLLLTRTFSKAHGLAGLRVGYAIAQPALADMLRRVRAPFSVGEAGQLAAVAALQDTAFLERTVAHNSAQRQRLVAGLEALGIRCLPSHTNFVLAQVGDGAAWAQRLQARGLLLRPVSGYGLPEWLRIGIGTEEDTQRLLAAFAAETAPAR